MTAGDLVGVTVLQRPVKVVALGMTILMLALAWLNLANRDAGLGDSVLGDVVGATALVAAVALLGGWWGRSQRMAEVGLLLAFGVYLARTVFLLATAPADQGVLLGIGAAVIAGGSYLLERESRDA